MRVRGLGTYCDVCDQDISTRGVRLCAACFDGELASAQDGTDFVVEIEAARRRIFELQNELVQVRYELAQEKLKGK